jgi:hypothetical protein
MTPPQHFGPPVASRHGLHLLAATLFLLVAVLTHLAWLKPYQLPQRGDPDLPFQAGDLTPLFYVWNTVIQQSIFHRKEFPLWSDHIYAGEPFFAKPQVGVLSVTTLLLSVLPAEVASTWTFLLHLAISGVGAYLLHWTIWRRSQGGTHKGLWRCYVASLCAGLNYETSTILLEHTAQGHAPIVLTACWSPFVVLLLIVSLQGRRTAALAAGLLQGLIFLSGGDAVTLYTGLASALLVFCYTCCGTNRDGLLPPFLKRIAGASVTAALYGAAAVGAAAVKLLPAVELLPITNRAGGLEPALAAAPIVEFSPPRWLAPLDPTRAAESGPWLVGPATLSLVGLFRLLTQRATFWFGLSTLTFLVVGALSATQPVVYQLLWLLVPGFRYQRIPQRALLLLYLALSCLLGSGTAALLHWLAQRRVRTKTVTWIVVPLTIVSSCAENIASRSPLPPTRDIRLEQKSNAILQYLAHQEGYFRIHCVESRDRNWGIQHVATPLGLNTLVGWDHMWLLDFLGAEGRIGQHIPPFVETSYRVAHPARFWGLLNVRWVTSSHLGPVMPEITPRGQVRFRNIPGLRWVQSFPESPYAQPLYSDGPHLYENPSALGPAWYVPTGIVVIGPTAPRRWATYRLLDLPEFDPARVVLLEFDSVEDFQQADAWWLPRIRWGILVPRGPAESLFDLAEWPFPTLHWNPDEQLIPPPIRMELQKANREDRPPAEVHYRRLSSNHRLIEVSTPQDGFLVLAEKFAHFPGWTCSSTPHRSPLLKANGVLTAIPIHSSTQQVHLRYLPASFLLGLVASLSTLGLVGWCFLRFRQRYQPSTHPGAVAPLLDPGHE